MSATEYFVFFDFPFFVGPSLRLPSSTKWTGFCTANIARSEDSSKRAREIAISQTSGNFRDGDQVFAPPSSPDTRRLGLCFSLAPCCLKRELALSSFNTWSRSSRRQINAIRAHFPLPHLSSSLLLPSLSRTWSRVSCFPR